MQEIKAKRRRTQAVETEDDTKRSRILARNVGRVAKRFNFFGPDSNFHPIYNVGPINVGRCSPTMFVKLAAGFDVVRFDI